MSQEKFILAIDQGTTSSRAIVFNHDGQIVSSGQLEHEQIFPRAGWVEHDPLEIIRNTNEAIGQALTRAGINRHQLEGVGITNQRETTVIWNKNTGKPVYNAIVWQDTRTQKICDELAGDEGPDKYKERVGLPLATYFAGPKAKWVFDNVEGVKESAEAGELLFGTMDTWVLWNLTGGVNGGVHVTDVTNASRTMLMNIKSLDWNEEIAGDMGIPVAMLPEIKSCSEVYGYGAKNGLIIDTPICGIVGDQQAATFGQACFEKGQAKNTYGTGNFMLINTGNEPVASKNGLLTTVAYKIGDNAAVYALEGSVAVTGSLVQWLRDNFGIISEAPEVETLAKQVDDNGGCYIVPAFSGLFAPHWESDARGVMVGLTRFVNKNHIARAALESVAFQSREVLDAMDLDSGVKLTELKVDGGMVANETLMQFQADLLGVPVIRPEVVETTALGAAYAAGIAVKFWNGEEDVKSNWREDKRWLPSMDEDTVARAYRLWNKAVEKSKNWVDEDVEALQG
ncbi:glycerol kinase GlpK [Brevibacterium sp. UCMA 11752]|uniref:glycerol kinase GlpK n=1 Tax=Brevibacterium sp. UCMA 11752 TaxID=2745946 RepID=UPI001F1AC07D|nr:glycerol kinase GlpK [Brevibacterium sp. UCMA 11752]MCF2588991.1 glycerol kinase GlpK [Brevibacterium sp. UCMA 11752]